MAYRLLALAFILLLHFDVFATTVECDGASVVDITQEIARETALKNSNESCVRNTLFKIYGEDTVKNNEWRLKKIYGEAQSFITSSKIISEELRPELNSYMVTVEATVNENDIKNYMTENGIALVSEKVKTVLPLIVERTSIDGEGEFWWGTSGKFTPKKTFSDIEKALAMYLSQGNFILMNPFESQINVQVPESYRYMDMKLNELADFGKLFGAGLVASGYVWTDCKKETSAGKTACETTLSVQIISTETLKITAAKRTTEKWSTEKKEEAQTISRARACKVVAENLVYQLSKKWDKRASSNFRISVSGVKNYAQYSKIRNCLLGSQINGLYGVVERYQSRGLFVFEGERRSDTNIIQNSIESKCFSDLGADISTSGADMIEIKI